MNKASADKNLLENYNIRLIKVKGHEKNIPIVSLIAIKENAALFSVESVSSIKQFKFVLEHTKKASSAIN